MSRIFLLLLLFLLLPSCQSAPKNPPNFQTSQKLAETSNELVDPAASYLDNLSENVLLFPWPEPGPYQRPDASLEKGRVEHLYFALPKWWDNFYNWQQQDPAATAWPGSPFSSGEASPFNKGRRSIAMQAIKRPDQHMPSMQLFVYENKDPVHPKDYLQQLRELWKQSATVRELRAPVVLNFGHRDNYGYLLHFMSREYLYIEFILFVRRRAVHFVFQSPHDELSGKSSIAEFYRQSRKTLDQGIYFRNQRRGEAP